ncbi:MAG: type III-B CRISPR module-associated protein Cmr5 [Aggregatilineales bacterium]
MATKYARQQTLQQRRASSAYQQVESVGAKSHKSEYGSLIRGLPAMIQTDGLGQSLAFLLAKGKPHHKEAYQHLQEWLSQEEQFGFNGGLLQWLLEQDTSTYRQVTAEALAYLVWLKRFVEAKGWKAKDDGRG